MAWFDKFAYQVAPYFGYAGKGIADAIQDTRLTAAANAYNAAPDLARFADIKTPEDIYSPEHLATLEKVRQVNLGRLQQQEAAPIAKALQQFAAEGNDADPNFTGAEWVKGMMTTPALGGRISEADYDTMKAGSIPASKRGDLPLSAFAANPVAADLIQGAEKFAQNKGTVARVFADRTGANPMDLAALTMDKNLAGNFKDTTSGLDQFSTMDKRTFDVGQAGKAEAANAALGKYVAEFPLKGDGSNWTEFAEGLWKIPGVTPDVVQKTLSDIEGRNKGRAVGNPLQLFARSGDATTTGNVKLDMFGRPIEGTKVTVTNHPRQTDSGAASDQRETARTYTGKAKEARSLQTKAAQGFKGIMIIDGVQHSFDGSKESQDALKNLANERIAELVDNPTYAALVKKHDPQWLPKETPAAELMYAVNPATKERIVSKDGGKSWAPTR